MIRSRRAERRSLRRPATDPSRQAADTTPDPGEPRAGPVGRRRSTWAAFAWLVVLGLIAITIGGHDAVAGGEITVRLWGTLVLGAGLVLVAGAVGLHRGRPQGRSLATLAAILGMVVGAITFLAQVVNDEPDGRLVVWGAIIVMSAAAGWTVWRLAPPQERTQGIWRQLPVLKSVVSLGIVFSIAQFWYGSIYIPATAPASLTLEAKIEPLRTDEDPYTVRGSVIVRNTSGTRVNVLSSLVEISGESVDPKPLKATDFAAQMQAAYEKPDTIGAATRYASTDDAVTLSRGRLVPDATYFEPGETLTVPFVAWVPRQPFALVNVDVFVAVARGRVLALETSRPKVNATRDSVVTLTAVPEAGWLRSLTRGDRLVRAEYGTDVDSPTMSVAFTSHPTADPPEDFDRRMKRFYGYALVGASALEPLPHRQGATTGR